MDTEPPAGSSHTTTKVRPLPTWQRWGHVGRFALQRHGLQIFIIVAGLLIYVALRLAEADPQADAFAQAPPGSFLDWFDLLGNALNGLTFLVAVFVWFGEVREDWEESLPKLLNVCFLYQALPVMVCRHAYLAGEADIRQWGQQIGWQFLRQNLDFRPNLESPEPLLVIGTDGRAYQRHAVRFHLTRLPSELAAQPEQGLCRDMMEGPLDAEVRSRQELAKLAELRDCHTSCR